MKKGGFMKDALILCMITLIAGAALGGVYEITKAPIQAANDLAKENANKMVLSVATSFESDDLSAVIDEANIQIAGLGFGNVLINECVAGVDASGNLVGYVVTATSKDGYGGAITASIGIDLDGAVKGIEFLTIKETVGFGMAAKDDPDWKTQFFNKAVTQFAATKSGAAADNEIDAIGGATITSNAVTGAVNAAVYFVNNCLEQ